MRKEIMFRGKHVDSGKWIYGYYVEQYGSHKIYLPNGLDSRGFRFYHVVPATVGQFTGFYDINGVPIYEGDIVDVLFDVGYIGVSALRMGKSYVVFFDGMFQKCKITGNICERCYTLFITSDRHTVIGNIHDNPELLEPDREQAKLF